MKPVTYLLLFLAFLIIPISTYAAKPITLVADDWCPYTCDPDSEQKGFVVDIASAIFETRGYQIQYLLIPWSRALLAVEKGDYGFDAALGTSPEEFPKGIFPEEEIGVYYNYFFVRSDSNWTFKGSQSFKNHVLGGVQDYSYGNLMPYINKYKNTQWINLISGVNIAERNLKLLILKRIDIYVEDKNVGLFAAYKNGYSKDIKIAGFEGEGVRIFPGFTPAKSSSQKYAQIFSTGIRELRRNGKLEKILASYGLEDWK